MIDLGIGLVFMYVAMVSRESLFLQSLYMLKSHILPIDVVSSMVVMSGCSMCSCFQSFVSMLVLMSITDLVAFRARL